MLAAREQWFNGLIDLDPSCRIFIDESGHDTKMAWPRWSRSARRAAMAYAKLKLENSYGFTYMESYSKLELNFYKRAPEKLYPVFASQ